MHRAHAGILAMTFTATAAWTQNVQPGPSIATMPNAAESAPTDRGIIKVPPKTANESDMVQTPPEHIDPEIIKPAEQIDPETTKPTEQIDKQNRQQSKEKPRTDQQRIK